MDNYIRRDDKGGIDFKGTMKEIGATLLGVRDEQKRAQAVGAETRKKYIDKYDRLEDTVRHGIMHGLFLDKEGKTGFREKLSSNLMNLQKNEDDTSIKGKVKNFVADVAGESSDQESEIDLNNNKFSAALRKKMIAEGDTSEESFIDAVVNIARGLRKGEESPEIDGLKLQLSLGKLNYPKYERFKNNILNGPTPWADNFNFDDTKYPVGAVGSSTKPLQRPKVLKLSEGGTAMKKQMEMFEEGGLRDDGTNKDPVSGNDVPSGSMAEEVRDDIPAQLSEGEYVVPADVVRFYGVKFFEDLRMEAKIGLANMEKNGRIGGEPVAVTMIASTAEEELSKEEEKALEELMGAAKGGLTGYAPGGSVTNTGQQLNQSSFNPANYAVVGGAPKGGTYPNQSSPTILVPYVHATDSTKPIIQVPTINGTVQQGFVVPQGYIPQSEYKPPAPKVSKGGDSKSGGTGTANKPDNDPWGTTEEYDFNNWGEEDFLKEAETQLGKSSGEALGQGLATAIAGPVGYIAAGAYNNVDGIARVRAMAMVAEAKGLDDVAAKLRTEANEAVENSGWLTKFSEKMGWIDGQNKFDAIMKNNPITSTTVKPVTPTGKVSQRNVDLKGLSNVGNLSGKSTKEKSRILKTATENVAPVSNKIEDDKAPKGGGTKAGGADLDTALGISGVNKGGLLTKPKRKPKTVKPRGKGLASK